MWWRWTLVTGKVFSIQLDRQRLKVWFYIRGRDVAASKPIQTLPAGTGTSSIAMFSSSGSHQWGWEGWPTRGSQCSPWQIYPRSCAWCISRINEPVPPAQTGHGHGTPASSTDCGTKGLELHGETATLVRPSTPRKSESSWWVLQCSVFCEEELKQLHCAPGLMICPGFLHNCFFNITISSPTSKITI